MLRNLQLVTPFVVKEASKVISQNEWVDLDIGCDSTLPEHIEPFLAEIRCGQCQTLRKHLKKEREKKEHEFMSCLINHAARL